jgi:hypothetical protein
MTFLVCGTTLLTKHSLLCCPVSGIRRLVSSPESKPFSLNTGDTMISGAPPRVGTMRRPIYTPSCSTETMEVLPPMTPRRGTWGGSRVAAVRHRRDGWATRGVCFCARRPRVRSTTRLGAFGVNRYRLQHRCAAISAQAPAAVVVWKKDGFKFHCFAAKTVGCAAKWWSSHKE